MAELDAGIFHGDVVGTQDVVTFQGRDLPELRKAFRDSVDDYLSFCQETGQPPEKPFSGKFVTRLDPELHRKVSMLAQSQGLSLNQLVCNCLEAMTRGEIPQPQECAPQTAPVPRRQQKKAGRPTAAKASSKRRPREYA
jgi:predicted HicB family RNase H-like nuclease